MGEKGFDSDFVEEETLNLESTGRYRVTGHRRAHGEPGITLLKTLAADRQLNSGRNQPAIRKVFVDRGIMRR